MVYSGDCRARSTSGHSRSHGRRPSGRGEGPAMVEGAPFPAGEPVSTAEHEQLRRDFAALTEQFEAASAVLEAMGRSASDPDTVLDAIVENARRLCRGDASHLYLLEDGVYRLIRSVTLSEESIQLHRRPPDADGPRLADRPGRARPTGTADPGRPGGPGVRPVRPAAGRRFPHHHGRSDDPGRQGRRCARCLAQRREPVRRPGDGHRQRVRRPGGDGGQRRPAGPAARGPQRPSSPARSASWRRCRRSARRSAPAWTSTTS